MKFFFWLFIFLSPLPAYALDACAPDAKAAYTRIESSYSKGLLFRIEKCGIEPSYIFGTLHSDNPRYNTILNAVVLAITPQTHSFFEILTDKESNAKAASYLRLPENKNETLQTIVGNELFQRTLAAMPAELGFTPETLNKMTPWAAAVLLQLPPPKADGQVIDEKLQSYAATNAASVTGLETLASHFAIFTNLKREDQIDMLREAVEDKTLNDKLTEQMEDAYYARDLRTLDEIGKASFEEISKPELREYITRELLYKRNAQMVRTALPALSKGRAFVAVGALHLPGREGMLDLLEREGFFITPLEQP